MAAPDKLIIDTPEQIALEYTLAGPGSRFLALAVDTVLQVLALLTLVLLLVAPIIWFQHIQSREQEAGR